MKMKLVGFLSILAVMTAAHAGNRQSDITFTAGLGVYGMDTSRFVDDGTALPILSLAYNVTQAAAVEFTFADIHTNYTLLPFTSVHGNLYNLSGLYRFNTNSPFNGVPTFEPYVSLGLGVLNLSPNRLDANAHMNVNFGLGTQIFFSDRVALRPELRDFYSPTHGRNDVMFSLGLSVLFNCNPVVVETNEVYK